MEGDDRHHHQTLEEQAEAALATGETAIEKADAGDDEPDEEGADDEVDVVELVASVLRVDVRLKVTRVAAPWLAGVVLRLRPVSLHAVHDAGGIMFTGSGQFDDMLIFPRRLGPSRQC